MKRKSCYAYIPGKLHRNWKTATVLPCPNCEKLFWFPNYRLKYNHTFCSKSCELKYRSTHKSEYYLNSPEFIKRVKPKISGKNNHNYTNGESVFRKKAIRLFGNKCQKCGSGNDIHVHHKDYDRTNNPEDGSNWSILCRSCHSSTHNFVKNFKGIKPPKIPCKKYLLPTGEYKTASEICSSLGISIHTFKGRIRRGWKMHRVLTTPKINK